MGWEEVVDKHGAALLLYARQWTESRADAEEAVQEGLVRVWRSRYRDAPDLLPLLYTAVKRSALDQGRSRRRRQERERKAFGEAGESVGLFASGLESEELRAEVEKALTRLPPEQREVLVMKVWGELTFQQIGTTLGVSVNTAASRYRYALAALRGEIGRDGR